MTEMNIELNQRCVKDEMSTDVVAVQPTASLIEAMNLMEENAVTALPVVDDENRCVGLISATDIVAAARSTADQLEQLHQAAEESRSSRVGELLAGSIIHRTVHDAMRFKLKYVHQETPLAKAGSKMLWTRFHHLPVVDSEQRLVGIISTLDLLAAFVKEASSKKEVPHDSSNVSDTETCDDLPAT